MKKVPVLLVLLLSLIAISGFCQSSVYKPFCNNPSWTVVSTNFGISSYVTYQYQSDTTIGSYTYKKIHDMAGSSFVLFREDVSQKKVYQYDLTNSADYLYIDFNLNYGDPFNLTLGGSVYSLTVCAKDSMLINGCYHNKVVLSDNGCFVRYSFVEGILSDVNPLYPFAWPGDPQTWTTCECHNGQFYYTNLGSPWAPFNCYLTCSPEVTCNSSVGINESEKQKNFEVHPNPTNSLIHIKMPQRNTSADVYHVKVVDVLGKEILNEPYKEELDISPLEKGIYFLSLYQNGTLLATKKVIKE